VVFDLGANIGSFTLYLTKECGMQVKTYSFEPHSQNYDYLLRNISINSISRNTAINAAIGELDGNVNLEQPAGLDSIRITHGEATGLSTVCTKLSTYCTKNDIKKIALMKIDIEGGEYALFDADFEFVVNHVEKMLLEYHNLDQKRNVEHIISKFQEYYEIEKVHNFVDMPILHLQRKLTKYPTI
jgi:FkbM family methyltransferase